MPALVDFGDASERADVLGVLLEFETHDDGCEPFIDIGFRLLWHGGVFQCS